MRKRERERGGKEGEGERGSEIKKRGREVKEDGS